MGSKSVESRSPLVWLGFLFSLVFSVYFTTFFDLLILTIYVPRLTSLPVLLPASPRDLALFRWFGLEGEGHSNSVFIISSHLLTESTTGFAC